MKQQNSNSTEAGQCWYAVYSKPRQEQVALEHLQRQGFDCFLPMALNPYQRRSKKAEPRIEPLFPRYLFLQAQASVQNLAAVRSTRGVVGLVRMGFELVQVSGQVIEGLRQRVSPGSGLIELAPAPLHPGDAVQVFDGPFAGAEGVLQEHSGEKRSMLLMSILGRKTRIEVDRQVLKRAS